MPAITANGSQNAANRVVILLIFIIINNILCKINEKSRFTDTFFVIL